MKPGQTVTYLDRFDAATTATVSRVGESGPSTCKILDLTVNGQVVPDIPHWRDREDAGPCWLLESESLPE